MGGTAEQHMLRRVRGTHHRNGQGGDMSADLNTVTLVGRLTRDPERKDIGSTSLLNLRLAFSASSKQGDTWEDVPQYVDVTVWGKYGDALEPYMHKGDQIVVSGRLAWREWEQPDGTKRQAHQIVAEKVQLPAFQRRDDAPAPAPVQPAPVAPVAADDDIPF